METSNIESVERFEIIDPSSYNTGNLEGVVKSFITSSPKRTDLISESENVDATTI
jgi:hypothetical protein